MDFHVLSKNLSTPVKVKARRRFGCDTRDKQLQKHANSKIPLRNGSAPISEILCRKLGQMRVSLPPPPLKKSDTRKPPHFTLRILSSMTDGSFYRIIKSSLCKRIFIEE